MRHCAQWVLDPRAFWLHAFCVVGEVICIAPRTPRRCDCWSRVTTDQSSRQQTAEMYRLAVQWLGPMATSARNASGRRPLLPRRTREQQECKDRKMHGLQIGATDENRSRGLTLGTERCSRAGNAHQNACGRWQADARRCGNLLPPVSYLPASSAPFPHVHLSPRTHKTVRSQIVCQTGQRQPRNKPSEVVQVKCDPFLILQQGQEANPIGQSGRWYAGSGKADGSVRAGVDRCELLACLPRTIIPKCSCMHQ